MTNPKRRLNLMRSHDRVKQDLLGFEAQCDNLMPTQVSSAVKVIDWHRIERELKMFEKVSEGILHEVLGKLPPTETITLVSKR